MLVLYRVEAQDSVVIETEKDQSLRGRFIEITENSETYQNYKVINRDRLDLFWSQVDDSLARYQKGRAKLEADLDEANQGIAATKNQITQTQGELEEVKFQRDRISFLSLDLLKNNYSYLVWSIIAVLASLLVISYLRYINNNRTTKKVKKESREIESEFEEFKKRAREKEIKLKRDLQTEINTVEELKQKVTLHKT